MESSRAAAAAAGVMQYLSTGIGSRVLERGGGPVCDSPALILLLILSSRLSGHLLRYCCTSPSPPCTYRPTVGLGQPSEPSSYNHDILYFSTLKGISSISLYNASDGVLYVLKFYYSILQDAHMLDDKSISKNPSVVLRFTMLFY